MVWVAKNNSPLQSKIIRNPFKAWKNKKYILIDSYKYFLKNKTYLAAGITLNYYTKKFCSVSFGITYSDRFRWLRMFFFMCICMHFCVYLWIYKCIYMCVKTLQMVNDRVRSLEKCVFCCFLLCGKQKKKNVEIE